MNKNKNNNIVSGIVIKQQIELNKNLIKSFISNHFTLAFQSTINYKNTNEDKYKTEAKNHLKILLNIENDSNLKEKFSFLMNHSVISKNELGRYKNKINIDYIGLLPASLETDERQIKRETNLLIEILNLN